MSDELPKEFRRVKAREAPAELRARVLDAVAGELSTPTARRRPRWERTIEVAAAACLLVGLGLNVWQWQAERRWHARMYGPQPSVVEHSELENALASITDQATARSIIERMSAVRRSTPSAESEGHPYERLLGELAEMNEGSTL